MPLLAGFILSLLKRAGRGSQGPSLPKAARLLILVAAGCACTSLPSPIRAESPPTFSIVDQDLVVAGTPGRAALIVKADGLAPAGMNKQLENIRDLELPQPPPVQVGFEARLLDRTDSSRRWVLTATVQGPLPSNATQKRYLSFSYDGAEFTLSYNLTNRSAASFAWTIKPPPGELSLGKARGVDIGIAVQELPATNVRVMQTALIEQSTKTPLAGNWSLCRMQEGACDPKIDLDAHSANRLWLRPADKARIVGKYTGTITIGATERPDGETFNLTVYETTLWHQIAGALVIAFGVVLAWISTTWFQSRINRAQLLLPAIVLRERVEALQRRASAAPEEIAADLPNTHRKLDELIKALSERELESQGLLPAKFPIPFKAMSPPADAYKEYFAKLTKTVAMLETLMENGFEEVWKEVPRPVQTHKLDAIKAATQSIDGLSQSDPVPSPDALVKTIQDTLARLHTVLSGAQVTAESVPGFAARLPTFEQLTVEIRNFSALTWLVFAILATALGTYILVILNLGFGVAADYFVCLFWGFGLPVGGQQLAQSTTGSVATVLGIPVPKSG
jgi:hypothetical protein